MLVLFLFSLDTLYHECLPGMTTHLRMTAAKNFLEHLRTHGLHDGRTLGYQCQSMFVNQDIRAASAIVVSGCICTA